MFVVDSQRRHFRSVVGRSIRFMAKVSPSCFRTLADASGQSRWSHKAEEEREEHWLRENGL